MAIDFPAGFQFGEGELECFLYVQIVLGIKIGKLTVVDLFIDLSQVPNVFDGHIVNLCLFRLIGEGVQVTQRCQIIRSFS